MKKGKSEKIKWLSRLLCLMLGLGMSGAATAAAEEMTMMVFTMGKADAILLRSGESSYLIDTAYSDTWDDLEKGLTAYGVDHLDGVIITHTDSDHVGGLKKLLKSDIAVDHVYSSGYYCEEDKNYKKNAAVKAAENQGREVEFLLGGDALPLDGGSLRVLGPLEPAEEKENDNSVVLLAEAAGGSILLTGDMEFPEEESLLSAGVIPQADVLKVANHGDDDATSNALLSAIQPSIAVISTSTAEKSSTPAKRVLKALAAWNVEVYQTQEAIWGIQVAIRDGEITVERVDALPE